MLKLGRPKKVWAVIEDMDHLPAPSTRRIAIYISRPASAFLGSSASSAIGFLRVLGLLLLLPGPARRRHPSLSVRAHFVRPSWRQHLVSACSNVELNLGDLLPVEELVPRLHPFVGDSVEHDLRELRGRELPGGIGQARRVGRPDRVDAMASITVHMPPLPTVIESEERRVGKECRSRWS